MAKTIEIRQSGSPIRRPDVQRKTLIGLGLNKIGRTRELLHTRPLHGMLVKTQHMLEIKDGENWVKASAWLADNEAPEA